LTREETVMGDEEPVPVMLLGEEVATYEVIGLPPSEAGGLKETITFLSPGDTEVITGEPGTPPGVTALEGEELGPVPFALVALTVKV
jgi:hypothetical protein